MEDIRLNFLGLANEPTFIQIYIKNYDQEDQDEDGVFMFRLGLGADEYCPYWVTFKEAEGFDAARCEVWENHDLTKRWLHFVLSEASTGENINRLQSSRKFDISIDFILNETDYGNQIISVTPYLLKTKRQFGFLVDFHFRTKKGVPFNREVQKLSLSLDKNYRSNKNYYAEKHALIRRFIDDRLTRLFPINEGTFNLNITNELVSLGAGRLNNKKYIFGNGKTGPSQFQGIKSHGPYATIENDVHYLFLFEERFKSFANDVYLSLAGKSNPGTFPGLFEMFGLPISVSNVSRISLDILNVASLEVALEQVKKVKRDRGDGKLIVILLEESSEDENPALESPYYYLKFNLLKQNIPLQVLSYEKVGSSTSLKWSTSNIALQIFSKLGGIPWLVTPSNNDCLILGIGSSHSYDHESDEIHKYLAYSVCLDSSGLYKRLSVLSESDEKGHYLSDLEKNLTQLLKEPEFETYRKVVLHVPFKIKKDEIQSIENALSSIAQIEFKVIKVNTINKFFGFSTHNTRVPYESTYVKLSKDEYVVWFEGLQYGKEIIYKSTANPVHIQFMNSEKTSNDDDFTYLQDVLNLSGANWRGFNSKNVPISIYYSKLIADYTKVFENFEGFDKSMFSTNKPWFL